MWNAVSADLGNFWSGHRIWVTIATLAAPFIIQAETHGWRSLLTLVETLESAALALGLSVAGNLVLSFFVGAKSLDAGLCAQIEKRDKTITDQGIEIQQHEQKLVALIEKPQRTPAQEHHFRQAQSELQKLPDHAKIALRHIWSSEVLHELPGGMIIIPGLKREQSNDAMAGELGSSPLVRVTATPHPSGDRRYWEIAPAFRDALSELLFPPEAH